MDNGFLSSRRSAHALAACLLCSGLLGGCAVVAVVDTAATLAVDTVGLAAGAAVGAVRITGKALGAAADAVIPGGGAKD